MDEQYHGGQPEEQDSLSLSPEVNDTEATIFANRIRSRIPDEGEIIITDIPSTELLSIVGVANYGWWEGDTYTEADCTSKNDATRLNIKVTIWQGGTASIIEQEYELGGGQRPYYDELRSTTTRQGEKVHGQEEALPVYRDPTGIYDEESDAHVLRRAHVKFAGRVLDKCVPSNRLQK